MRAEGREQRAKSKEQRAQIASDYELQRAKGSEPRAESKELTEKAQSGDSKSGSREHGADLAPMHARAKGREQSILQHLCRNALKNKIYHIKICSIRMLR
jgi:hypothetical protein